MSTDDGLASLLSSLDISPRLTMLGAGNMGGTMVRAWHSAGVGREIEMAITARSKETIDKFNDIPNLRRSTDNSSMLAKLPGGICVIAVKPYMLRDLVRDCGEQMMQQRLIISVMAGVTIKQIDEALYSVPSPPAGGPIVCRVMPNTPSLIGRGANVFAIPKFDHADKLSVLMELLFKPLGLIVRVEEDKINAVSGLAGCGPAYIYTVIDALSDGGVKMGIPRALSTQLAAHMVAGAAQMVLQTGKHPGQLKDDVCSPGGATIVGVHALEAGGVRNTFINAVEAATKRCQEMEKL